MKAQTYLTVTSRVAPMKRVVVTEVAHAKRNFVSSSTSLRGSSGRYDREGYYCSKRLRCVSWHTVVTDGLVDAQTTYYVKPETPS